MQRSRLVRWSILPLAALVVVTTAGVLSVWLRPLPTPLAPPPQGVTLWNVSIANPGRKLLPRRTIEAATGRIGSIYEASARLDRDLPRLAGEDRDSFARRLDTARACAGSFVTPGLIELDASYPRDAGERAYANLVFLRFGVTSVRLDRTGPALALLRDEILDGRVAGPRLFLWRGEPPRDMPPVGSRGPADRAVVLPPAAVPLVRRGQGAESPGWSTWWRLAQVGREDLDQGWLHATILAARRLGSVDLGVVAQGAPADLLVFAEDPRRNPAAYESLRGVVVNGRFYDRHTLDDALRALANALGEPPPDLEPRLAAPE